MLLYNHSKGITDRPKAGKEIDMKKINARDYKRAARDAMKKSFGFAPALKNSMPREGGDNGAFVPDVAVCVAGKGYSWSIGHDVERAEAYDI